MTPPNLTDNDRADLARFLVDRYPLSPRVRSYKAVLAKLARPPIPRPEPMPPPPKPPAGRNMVLTKKRGR